MKNQFSYDTFWLKEFWLIIWEWFENIKGDDFFWIIYKSVCRIIKFFGDWRFNVRWELRHQYLHQGGKDQWQMIQMVRLWLVNKLTIWWFLFTQIQSFLIHVIIWLVWYKNRKIGFLNGSELLDLRWILIFSYTRARLEINAKEWRPLWVKAIFSEELWFIIKFFQRVWKVFNLHFSFHYHFNFRKNVIDFLKGFFM